MPRDRELDHDLHRAGFIRSRAGFIRSRAGSACRPCWPGGDWGDGGAIDGCFLYQSILDVQYSLVYYQDVSDMGSGKREAILAAAARLFVQKGYEATTMDDIAGAAGVSKATLYRYVTSKEELREVLAPELAGADLRSRDARGAILNATITLVARQGFART